MDFIKEMAMQSQSPNRTGLTIGIVKENWNEKQPGTIKVEYQQGEAGKNISGWMPVMTMYGGGSYGSYALPEIGDVVVICYLGNDVNAPIALGCLYSQKENYPKNVADKENSIKSIKTKGGHQISFNEQKDKESITIQTPKGLTILLDDENEQISLQDKEKKNKLELNTKNGELSLQAEKKITVKIGTADAIVIDKQAIKMTAQTISADAKTKCEIKGNTIAVNAAVSAEIKGNTSLKAESSGITEIKGSMLKLN